MSFSVFVLSGGLHAVAAGTNGGTTDRTPLKAGRGCADPSAHRGLSTRTAALHGDIGDTARGSATGDKALPCLVSIEVGGAVCWRYCAMPDGCPVRLDGLHTRAGGLLSGTLGLRGVSGDGLAIRRVCACGNSVSGMVVGFGTEYLVGGVGEAASLCGNEARLRGTCFRFIPDESGDSGGDGVGEAGELRIPDCAGLPSTGAGRPIELNRSFNAPISAVGQSGAVSSGAGGA